MLTHRSYCYSLCVFVHDSICPTTSRPPKMINYKTEPCLRYIEKGQCNVCSSII